MSTFISIHSSFVDKITKKKDLSFYATENCRLSTIYWTIACYKILNIKDRSKKEYLEFVMKCRNKDGGFGASIGYPSTILSTFNALQILFLYENYFYDEDLIRYITEMIGEGVFRNDIYGEEDTRFICCGILSLHLIFISKNIIKNENENTGLITPYNNNKFRDFLLEIGVNVKKIVSNILECYNEDGGFGAIPNAESHAAQVFTCLSTLRSLNLLDVIDKDRTIRFLVMRQCNSGGLNGRPNKKEDVCYSFWAFSSLRILEGDNLIDKNKLLDFILSCRKNSEGGFSDRPGNEPDLFHTLYSLAALAWLNPSLGLTEIDGGFGI
ncbi:putative geranylgeranyl transferase type-2 subunit beta [Astathelohania contejeani]|uniref:Geranylgeranyl transferase type-2 subunit beta n=1 Tax=Astathelohania contejeani TaxID=164912 RepID=A0ABQ7I073_9MICR|nr:putative geranylgeranyl transferase type-2 subunit beta [Thelohania contejeani]